MTKITAKNTVPAHTLELTDVGPEIETLAPKMKTVLVNGKGWKNHPALAKTRLERGTRAGVGHLRGTRRPKHQA